MARRSLLLLVFLYILYISKIGAEDDHHHASCDNHCGSAVANKTVKIVVNGPDTYEGRSPYVRQLTVSLAMRNLVAISDNTTSPFTFTTQFYQPYGDLVTSINGVEAGDKQYWELKVNGAPSQCGIDTRILNSGDVVQWSLEDIHSDSA